MPGFQRAIKFQLVPAHVTNGYIKVTTLFCSCIVLKTSLNLRNRGDHQNNTANIDLKKHTTTNKQTDKRKQKKTKRIVILRTLTIITKRTL